MRLPSVPRLLTMQSVLPNEVIMNALIGREIREETGDIAGGPHRTS